MLIPGAIYFRAQGEAVSFLLSHAEVVIACFPEDANEIAAYAIHQRHNGTLILHWLYVKHLLRRKHIATDLLAHIAEGDEMIVATHCVDDFTILRKKVKNKIVYDPFLLSTLRRNDENI